VYGEPRQDDRIDRIVQARPVPRFLGILSILLILSTQGLGREP
jgi:hypothetical protein